MEGRLIGFTAWLALAAISLGVLVGYVLWLGEGGVARAFLASQALSAGVASCCLAFYVGGPDDYRGDGTTRWDAYDAQGLTVTAVVVGLVVAAVALVLFVWPRRRFYPLLGLAGIVAAALIFCAYFANSLN
jgi:hypothetical protein